MVSEKAHSPLLNALVHRSHGRSKEFGLLGVCTTLKTATKSSITRALLQILLESALPVTANVPFAVVTCSHLCPWDWQEPKQLWDFWSSISCSWNWLVCSISVEKGRNTQNKERRREREKTQACKPPCFWKLKAWSDAERSRASWGAQHQQPKEG